jgi:thioredoxin-related protein
MNKQIILLIGLSLLGYAIYSKHQNNVSVPIVPVLAPSKPTLKTNIYYDEYEKCMELSKDYNKKIVIVFGADWCPYCRTLKKDIDDIFQFSKYIVCFIDTDQNEALVKKYRIRGLPTSIIIDSKETELSRKTGYKKTDYNQWLANSLIEEYTSWIEEH